MQVTKPAPLVPQRIRHQGLVWSSAGAVVGTMLLVFGSAAQQPSEPVAQAPSPAAIAAPRPVGVPENATPEEKGREILRLVIELVKRGDLRDTEFASRLLRLPIIPGKGFLGPNPPPFPQRLAKEFGYSFRDVGSVRQQVEFVLNPDEVCLQLRDFLSAFNKEFGIGMNIIRDNRGSPPNFVPPEVGWKEANSIHYTKTRSIYQGMPNLLGIEAGFQECALGILVLQRATTKN